MTIPMRSPRVAGLLLVLGCAVGCGTHQSPEVTPLAVVRISPDLAGGAPLLLNEAITVYFSQAIDPLSVTRDTVSVLDSEGNAVPGRLRTGTTWVTFEPRPPLQPSLEDGSLRPARDYRLRVAGFPRIDCVRGADGQRLAAGLQRSFRTADQATKPSSLPAPLRPIGDGQLPFLVVGPGAEPTLPVDSPRLRLRFSLPVLPQSLTVDAFQVLLVRPASGAGSRPVELVPLDVRVSSIDDLQGCAVELNLGSRPPSRDGASQVLQPGDFVFVKFPPGERSLRDYADRELQSPPASLCWTVVEGAAAVVLQWPGPDENWLSGPDLATPGFEVMHGALQPLVRVEGGDGSLGVFRPTKDTRLVPGVMLDRGDGTLVVSKGNVFSFAAIDIPRGITVAVDARFAPVQLLALGRAKIAGRLVIEGQSTNAPPPLGWRGDLATICASTAVAIVAIGGIEIGGEDGEAGAAVVASPAATGAPLALVSAGPVDVHAPIPRTILARERTIGSSASWVERCISVQVPLTHGLPTGVEVKAQGWTPFRTLPTMVQALTFHRNGSSAGVRVEWQAANPDPARQDQPDADPARMAAFREAAEGSTLATTPGSFVRLRFEARVRGGEPLPRIQSVSVLDR